MSDELVITPNDYNRDPRLRAIADRLMQSVALEPTDVCLIGLSEATGWWADVICRDERGMGWIEDGEFARRRMTVTPRRDGGDDG
jgi:hypothetical protein